MASTDTLINTVFDRRYRVLRKLGTGGMADVYLAEDQELGRRVAIKILNDRHASDNQFVERFRREASSAAGLSHPNIVSVYDRGEAGGTYYIAMEYLDGRTLKELIHSHGPTPIPVAIDYARQILAAVGFAHKNGIVHRDIKPHNVLVDAEGRLKVTDFGIARSGPSQMTEVGSIIGTAQYLSPEQARGAPVDVTSDLYSVGVVLYEMLTGVVPFTGDTPVEIAMKHLSAAPEPPSALRSDVPPDLDAIVLRALGKSPSERYRSAEEMDADLARVEQGLAVSPETTEAATAILAGAAPTAITSAPARAPARAPVPPARPPGTGEYEEPRPPRRPFWPWLLALVFLVAAGFGSWYVYTKIQHQLNANKPAVVPYVLGIREELAVTNISKAGLRVRVRRLPSADEPLGIVYEQDPVGGNRIDKGNLVTILVSEGKPKTKVPSVVGSSATEAAAALGAAKLKAKVVEINSDKPPNTVTAQVPKAGKVVVQGSTVRIKVSKGPKSVAVPPVGGLLFDDASAQLTAAGFVVARQDVDSDVPKDTVLSVDPPASTLQPKGSTITLTVSKGPKASVIPDVTRQDQQSAIATLKSYGFRAVVEMQDTSDPKEDGIVLAQDPAGGTQGQAGAVVTILVGTFTGATTSPTQ